MTILLNKFNLFEWGMIIAVIGFTFYFSLISEGVSLVYLIIDGIAAISGIFCVDGVYLTDKDKMVEFYAGMVKECQCPYTTQLVYTSDNRVTAGFGKKLLYK